jgi:DNA-binding response OmpR family regulator
MGDGVLTATDLAPRTLGGHRVLVVEPNADSAACLTAMLRLNGFDALACHSGETALRDVTNHGPRAVLLDLDLPDMDACDVIRKIRSGTNSSACAVLVVTAHADQAHRTAAFAAGADDYHLKPADPLGIVRSLTNLCQ